MAEQRLERTALLLAGLAEREAAAVQMMVQGQWPNCTCVVLPRQADFALPPQDAQALACTGVVLNLLGIGLLRHSLAGQEKLLDFLAGRSAVLLLHSGDSTWAAAQLPKAPGQDLILLTPPCSSAVLRQAMHEARLCQARPRPLAVQGGSGQSAAQPAAVRPALVPTTTYTHIGNGALDQLEQAVPTLQACDWVRLVRQSLQAQGRSRFELGPTAFVVDMHAGWLASTLPISAMQKMWQTPQMMSSLRMQALAQEQVQAIALRDFGERLGKLQKPLDMVVWELSREALKSLQLQLEHDLLLRLRRYPNFTHLGHSSALHMQLAALCAAAPRSLRQLQKLFAHAEQEVLRFAALCVLSGLAFVTPAAGFASAAAAPALSVTPETKAKQNFLSAFLRKLF